MAFVTSGSIGSRVFCGLYMGKVQLWPTMGSWGRWAAGEFEKLQGQREDSKFRDTQKYQFIPLTTRKVGPRSGTNFASTHRCV